MKYKKQRDMAVLALLGIVWLGLAVWAWVRPAEAVSASERRRLAQRPVITAESLQTGRWMQEFESYTLDQFPLREPLRSLKAAVQLGVMREKDNNGVYLAEGYAAKLDYPLHTESVDSAAEKFLKLYQTQLAGKAGQIYYAVIPDKNYFMAAKGGWPALDYDALQEQLRQKLGSCMKELSLFDQLSLACYYRTDPHWRQEALLPIAQSLAAQMGVELPQKEYTICTLDKPYYGLYYGYAALPMQPDTLSYYTGGGLEECTVYNEEQGQENPMYDLEKSEGIDPYEIFLSGSVSLLRIENPKAATNRRLVIFRDSFGSSLAPLLAAGYAEITLVDIRYLPSARVGQFVDFTGKDVLFLYSTQVLNNSEALK